MDSAIILLDSHVDEGDGQEAEHLGLQLHPTESLEEVDQAATAKKTGADSSIRQSSGLKFYAHPPRRHRGEFEGRHRDVSFKPGAHQERRKVSYFSQKSRGQERHHTRRSPHRPITSGGRQDSSRRTSCEGRRHDKRVEDTRKRGEDDRRRGRASRGEEDAHRPTRTETATAPSSSAAVSVAAPYNQRPSTSASGPHTLRLKQKTPAEEVGASAVVRRRPSVDAVEAVLNETSAVDESVISSTIAQKQFAPSIPLRTSIMPLSSILPSFSTLLPPRTTTAASAPLPPASSRVVLEGPPQIAGEEFRDLLSPSALNLRG